MGLPSIGNMPDLSGVFKTGMQTANSAAKLLATDEAQELVTNGLTMGVECAKVAGSLFGIDSAKVGEAGGTLFGAGADVLEQVTGMLA